MTATMRAMVLTEVGKPLTEQVVPKPQPGPGEVLIQVEASGVNPLDTKIAAGSAPHAQVSAPAILGLDLSGHIDAVGAAVTEFTVGQRVYGMVGGVGELPGTTAEYVVADARLLAPKPAALTMREAAALPLVAITAWEGLVDRADVQPGDNVLVLGAGAVGQAALQIAAARGANVFAAVRPARREAVEGWGATAIDIANEPPESWPENYHATDGFDIVYDTVGGAVLDTAFKVVKPYSGHVVSCLGWGTHNLAPLSFRSATYSGVFTLAPLLTGRGREHFSAILQHITTLVDDARMMPTLHDTPLAMSDINAAHELVARGNATGKVVLQGW